MNESYLVIVDSNEEHLHCYKRSLENFSSVKKCSFFVNAQDAISSIQNEEVNPSLIISEAKDLEVWGTFKTDRTIRQDIPVVVFTQSLFPIDIEMAVENQFDGYYIKGEDVDDFSDAIMDMLMLVENKDLILS